MSDTPAPPAKAPRKKRAAKLPAKVETHYGKKTLIAAITAAVFALLDLYMNLRHGINLPF